MEIEGRISQWTDGGGDESGGKKKVEIKWNEGGGIGNKKEDSRGRGVEIAREMSVRIGKEGKILEA